MNSCSKLQSEAPQQRTATYHRVFSEFFQKCWHAIFYVGVRQLRPSWKTNKQQTSFKIKFGWKKKKEMTTIEHYAWHTLIKEIMSTTCCWFLLFQSILHHKHKQNICWSRIQFIEHLWQPPKWQTSTTAAALKYNNDGRSLKQSKYLKRLLKYKTN